MQDVYNYISSTVGSRPSHGSQPPCKIRAIMGVEAIPIGSIVPFCGLYLGSYKVVQKRNY